MWPSQTLLSVPLEPCPKSSALVVSTDRRAGDFSVSLVDARSAWEERLNIDLSCCGSSEICRRHFQNAGVEAQRCQDLGLDGEHFFEGGFAL